MCLVPTPIKSLRTNLPGKLRLAPHAPSPRLGRGSTVNASGLCTCATHNDLQPSLSNFAYVSNITVQKAMHLLTMRPGSACYWVLQLSVRVYVPAAGSKAREAEESAS